MLVGAIGNYVTLEGKIPRTPVKKKHPEIKKSKIVVPKSKSADRIKREAEMAEKDRVKRIHFRYKVFAFAIMLAGLSHLVLKGDYISNIFISDEVQSSTELLEALARTSDAHSMFYEEFYNCGSLIPNKQGVFSCTEHAESVIAVSYGTNKAKVISRNFRQAIDHIRRFQGKENGLSYDAKLGL